MGGFAPDLVAFEDLASGSEKFDLILCYRDLDVNWFNRFENIQALLNYEVYSGVVPEGGLSYAPYEYYLSHSEQIQHLYEKLSDEKSKKALVSYINQKISGKYSYGEDIVDPIQYFDKDIIDMDKQKLFIDCGGYDGEDTERFFNYTDKFSKAIIFEADKDIMNKIENKLYAYTDRYTLIDKACYSYNGVLRFTSLGTGSSYVCENGDTEIKCVKIDDITANEDVTWIKMDIEGSELEALKGAQKTIRRCRPILSICLYHKLEDVFSIPEFIISLNLDYRFYIRRYSKSPVELVLFAV